MKFRGRFQIALLAAVTAAICTASAGMAFAYTTGTYGSGNYGACVYGQACSITLSSSGTVSLDVTPTASGSCTYQSDAVSVLTDDSNGYILTLADNSTNTALTNGGNTIAAGSGTFSSPATLSGNSWGYRVDGVSNFGPGPTTAVSNGSRDGTLFAGIEPSNSAGDILASTSSPADPAQNTTVWYGACTDTTASSGQYTTQVMYTAVAN